MVGNEDEYYVIERNNMTAPPLLALAARLRVLLDLTLADIFTRLLSKISIDLLLGLLLPFTILLESGIHSRPSCLSYRARGAQNHRRRFTRKSCPSAPLFFSSSGSSCRGWCTSRAQGVAAAGKGRGRQAGYCSGGAPFLTPQISLITASPCSASCC